MSRGTRGQEFADSPLWYRPVFSAMKVADAARRWASLLRWTAYTVAAVAVAGAFLRYVDTTSSAHDGAPFVNVAMTLDDFASALRQLTFPLGCAAVILVLSWVVKTSAARLDLDIVLAHDEEPAPGATRDSRP